MRANYLTGRFYHLSIRPETGIKQKNVIIEHVNYHATILQLSPIETGIKQKNVIIEHVNYHATILQLSPISSGYLLHFLTEKIL